MTRNSAKKEAILDFINFHGELPKLLEGSSPKEIVQKIFEDFAKENRLSFDNRRILLSGIRIYFKRFSTKVTVYNMNNLSEDYKAFEDIKKKLPKCCIYTNRS